MLRTYFGGRSGQASGYAQLLCLLNAFAAIVAAFYWTSIEYLVADPLRWATWVGVAPHPRLFDYPYLLTWALPVVGIFGSRLAAVSNRRQLALFLAAYPALFLGLILGWYYLAPQGWR